MNQSHIHIFNVAAIVVCISLTSSIAVSGNGSSPKGRPFVELQGQVVEVQDAVSTLEDRIDLLVGQVNTIEDALDANTAAITTLQMQNASLQAQIDALATDATSLQNQINLLEQENINLQAQIDSNSGDITSYETRISANEAEITSLTASLAGLTDLGTRIAENETMIGLLEVRVDQLEEDIAIKQNVVNGTCPTGSSIREINEDGTVICETDDVGGTTAGDIITLSINDYFTNYKTEVRYLACPPGYELVSGGYQSKGYYTQLWDNYPVSDARWRWAIYNGSGYSEWMALYIRCAQVN